MKIAFYINHIGIGGAERVLTNLCNRFAETDEVYLITSQPDPFHHYETSEKVNRICLCKKRYNNFILRNLFLCIRLKAKLKYIKPDCVVSFLGEPNMRLLFINDKYYRKIISIRNDPSKEYPKKITQFIFRRLLANSDGIVCQTKDVVTWLPSNVRDKAKIIMNQVDSSFYNIKREKGKYYVALGRLTAQKNYNLMIKSFAKFAKVHNEAELRIYGEGELKEDLSNLIMELKAENNIKIIKPVNNVPEVLSKSKGFILTSDYEGMPNALLEAMAIGLPVISTDCPCGGPRMMIQNNYNGILLPLRDEDKLVNALINIEENEGFANYLSKNAKNTALNNHPDIVFKEWKLYLNKEI